MDEINQAWMKRKLADKDEGELILRRLEQIVTDKYPGYSVDDKGRKYMKAILRKLNVRYLKIIY